MCAKTYVEYKLARPCHALVNWVHKLHHLISIIERETRLVLWALQKEQLAYDHVPLFCFLYACQQ
jgi:hypothetical protein